MYLHPTFDSIGQLTISIHVHTQNVGQLIGAIQPASELERVNVGRYCILRPLIELVDHEDARFACRGTRFQHNEAEALVARRPEQLVDLPDMIHACWEHGCSVRVERNVPQQRERRRVIGDLEKWVHVHDEDGSVYVDNPWRHGGRQVG